jgi:nitroimidazol reductase NimA-like FMN-containing flavoprotein (pyridoxamine 5'-phosphate oxidase superfamily)
MRRKEKQITAMAELEAVIRKALVCRLAMVDDGRPYIVPLCFGYQNNTLFFHSAKEGKKLDILKKNKNVCFEFDVDAELKKGKSACDWGMTFQSVIGFGEASLVEDPSAKRSALDIIMRQYAEGSFAYTDTVVENTAIIRVAIANMTGKRAAA